MTPLTSDTTGRSLALAITSYEGPRAMEIIEQPVRQPGPGEVSIDVSHAGMGFIDGLFSIGFGSVDLSFVPGLEVAGTVRAIGEGVHDVAPGDKVAALTITTSGGYAEVVCAPAALVARIPDGLDTPVAAATATNTVTAIAALSRVSTPLKGGSVLVHAGTGGVGSQFGQVARLLGAARVGAVVGSTAKADHATQLGYDEVYLRSQLDAVPTGCWDVVVDPVGGPATRAAADHLAPFGTLLRVGNASGADPVAIDSMRLWLTGTTAAGFNLGAWTAAHPDAVGHDLQRALDHVASGDIRVDVTHCVSLENAGAALDDVLAGKSVGKVVIHI